MLVVPQSSSGQATAGGSAHAGLEYLTSELADSGSGCALEAQDRHVKSLATAVAYTAMLAECGLLCGAGMMLPLNGVWRAHPCC